MSQHVSFLCFIHLSFLHPSGSAEPSTNLFLVTWSMHNLLIALPASPTHILFWLGQTVTFFPVYLFYIFEFEDVCICFIPMFQSFAIFLSQFAPIGSAKWPWTATQKGRAYHLDMQRATLVSIRLSAHIYVCSTFLHKILTTQFRLQPPVTSSEVTITFTPQQCHSDFWSNPTEGFQSVDHSSLYSLPHSSPHVDL